MTTHKRTATKTHPDRDGTILNVETVLLIAKGDVIDKLVELKTETREKVGKINDRFGKEFTRCVDKEHVHRGAANMAFQLAAMDDETLHPFLYHLFFYIKDLGLLDRAKKQEELFAAEEVGPAPKANGAANGHDKEHEGDDQATRIGAAARKVAETAGATLQK